MSILHLVLKTSKSSYVVAINYSYWISFTTFPLCYKMSVTDNSETICLSLQITRHSKITLMSFLLNSEWMMSKSVSSHWLWHPLTYWHHLLIHARYCTGISLSPGHCYLHSAVRVSWTYTNTLDQCSFAVKRPVFWNTLPTAIRNMDLSLNFFCQELRTLFPQSLCTNHIYW